MQAELTIDMPCTFQPIARPQWSPWGSPDHAEQVFNGVWSISTPRHGGFYVSAERRRTMPQAWLDATFHGQGKNGWFEEDADWSIVALAFPDDWRKWRGDEADRDLDGARNTFNHWIAKKIK